MTVLDAGAVTAAGHLDLRIDGRAGLSADLVAGLTVACEAAEDRGTGVLLVHAGGTPPPGWADGLDVGLVSKWERALRRLERLPVVTVGQAGGPIGGAALDVFLATDYRVAGPDTSLQLSAAGGATWPGMAMFRMAQQAGGARVRRSVLFGTPIEAAEAVRLGLVDEIVEATEAGAGADWLAALARPEPAMRRQLLLDAATTSFEEALGTHLSACDRVLRRTGAEAS